MAGQLPDERLQQHDRQQRVDPRGRRHQPQRRPERAGLQQHDHEEPDDGHRGDLRRLSRRRPGCRRRPTATSCRRRCRAGSPRVQQAAAVQQHLLGQPGRHPCRARPSPASGSPATPARRPLGHGGRRRHRACWRRRTRSSSRTPAQHPYTTSADQHAPADPDGRRRRTTSRCPSRPGARTPPSSTPRWSPSRRRRTRWVTTTSRPAPAAARRRPATSGAASKRGAGVPAAAGHPSAHRRSTSTTQARPGRSAGFDARRRRGRRQRPTACRRPPPAATTGLYFSTPGNTNPPGTSGRHRRRRRRLPLERRPPYSRVTTRRLSRAVRRVPCRGTRRERRRLRPGRRDPLLPVLRRHDTTRARTWTAVQDEDVVYYNAGTWSVFFDGSAHGLAARQPRRRRHQRRRRDAVLLHRRQLEPAGRRRHRRRRRHLQLERHSPTPGSGRRHGATGSPTDARTSTALVRVDATHFYLSFSGDTTRARPRRGPGRGRRRTTTPAPGRSYFDGTAHGLTAGNLRRGRHSMSRDPRPHDPKGRDADEHSTTEPRRAVAARRRAAPRFDRRRFLRSPGGAAGRRGRAPGPARCCCPRPAARPPATAGPLPRRHRRLDLPAADARHPAVPPRRPGARPVHDLHLRLPQRHRARRDRSGRTRRTRRSTPLRCSGSTSSTRRNPARLPGPADQPRAWRCGPTCSTRTRCTGTGSATSSRSSTASRPARWRCRPGASSPTSTARATRARTCTTATSRTWSTCTWA